MTPDRIRAKADAYVEGWRRTYGTTPSKHNVTLGLSVALHETIAGDAPGWEGEHNWGATQLRILNADEKEVLAKAGVKPVPVGATGPQRDAAVQSARAALASAVAKGKLADEPNGALHIDSSPGQPNYYWVFFRRFPDDASGAAFFVKVLGRTTAERAALENGNEVSLAAAMRAAGYYEGIYKQAAFYLWDDAKRRWVETQTQDPPAQRGSDLNIQSYATAVRRWTAQVGPALADWTPPAPSVEPSPEALAVAAGHARLQDELARGVEGLDALPPAEDEEKKV